MKAPALVAGVVLLGLVGTGLAHALRAVADEPPLTLTAPAGRQVPLSTASPGAAAGGAQAGDAQTGDAQAGSTPAPARTAGGGQARRQPSAAWLDRTSRSTGIPARALRAYGAATLALATQDPGCHLGWTTLAAIGAVESGHGTHGGAQAQDDGRPSVPVIGPALDGSSGFAAVRATPGSTALDGDPLWQHAVGPLQFLPATWERWAADGDGDGIADPQDVDDAALAAGRYLCAAGGDLSTGAGWRTAVLAYNHSDSYVAQVLDTAGAYDHAAAA